MHMPALPLVGSTLVASSELSNENIGIYIGPRFILIHIGDQAAKSSELLPYTNELPSLLTPTHVKWCRIRLICLGQRLLGLVAELQGKDFAQLRIIYSSSHTALLVNSKYEVVNVGEGGASMDTFQFF